MKYKAWLAFWSLQFVAVLCLTGGERFAITSFGYACRVFAFWALEPGLVLMETSVELTLFHSGLRPDQQWWLGVVLAVGLNAALFTGFLILVRRFRRRRTA